MPREPRALEPARTAARLVYTDSDLESNGTELRERWAEKAEDALDDVPDLWAQDHRAICNAFRGTDNALRGLNALRAEEGEEPLKTEEDLLEFFRTSEEWNLAYFGTYQDFSIRVWSYGPFDGQLAYALARAEDSVATFGTDIS